MIQLECSNCKAHLAIDDAFAGGVCRCQHCGTIQTVPKPGSQQAAASSAESPKALFKRKARIESALSPYNDSLDRAADEMDSAGGLSASAIAGAAMRRSSSPVGDDSSRKAGATAVAAPPARKQVQTPDYMPTPSKSAQSAAPATKSTRPMLLAAVGGVLGLALIGGIAALALSGGHSPKDAAEAETQAKAQKVIQPVTDGQVAEPSAAAGNISGIPLRGPSVVYILDRSGVTQQTFRQMTDLCLDSALTLGNSRQFQIVVWNNYQELAYPKAGLAEARAAQIEKARSTIVDTYAGSSNLSALLKSAVEHKASDIVLVSAVDADEQLGGDIAEALSGKGIRLHAIAIGADLQGDQLRKTTTSLGGEFRQLLFVQAVAH